MAVILVVEDDPDVAQLLQHTLVAGGHDVAVAVDGGAGLRSARERHPDLIVLDWMMPVKNGLEVCAELRANADFADTTIVMLSARSDAADIARARAAGADEYLTKPFRPRELRARIDALVVSQ